MSTNKGLAKLGNIVAETLLRMQMFPSLAARETRVAETNFAARRTKNVFAWSQCRSKGRDREGPCPPSFFSYKVKTDLYKMLKIKYYQATVWEVFKK